jgi:acyl-CoA thioester hydrolase
MTALRWSDMDAYGHINNVQFLRLLEDARVVAFAAAGSDEGGSVVDTGVLVASQRIEYLKPLVFRPYPVAIDLWVTRMAVASFDLGYEVLDDAARDDGAGQGGGPVIYARAETTLVLYDLTQHRPRRMRPAERVRLESWQGEPITWRPQGRGP